VTPKIYLENRDAVFWMPPSKILEEREADS
jgi:hypothetical protein